MEPVTKTLIIKKRGRKYFECLIGGYKAKLVINQVSEYLDIDRVVKLQVNDLSERSKYGVDLKFEPIAVLDDRDAEALRQAAIARRDAEKWLGYAEADARDGKCRTNAIIEARSRCAEYEHLQERLVALKVCIDRNEAAWEEEKRQRAEKKAEQDAAQAKRRQMRILFPISAAPLLGAPVRHGGRALVFESTGEKFRIDEDHPSICGAHLLGHEGEFGRYYYYREATADEAAALAVREAESLDLAKACSAREGEIAAIAAEICRRGDHPAGWHDVVGERLLDTQDIYGGGAWFVVADSAIWYVRNNGMDGDEWSQNNVVTGGAGAIGRRIPYNEEIAKKLRELDKK